MSNNSNSITGMLVSMSGLVAVTSVIVTIVSGTWLHWIAAGALCFALGWVVNAMKE